jgi:hypothetical protein
MRRATVPKAGLLTGNGCGGTNDGFVCLNATTPLRLGSTTSFSWQVQFDAASLLPETDWHIGARYYGSNPKTLNSVCVPTYTLPFATVGTTNFTASPAAPAPPVGLEYSFLRSVASYA